MYGQKVNRWVTYTGNKEPWCDFTIGKKYQLTYNDNCTGITNLKLSLGVSNDLENGWVNYETHKYNFREITFNVYLKEAELCLE